MDIDKQPDTNYVYDEIGNIVLDKKEKITSIKWNVYGKITEITRDALAADKNKTTRVRYTYDAAGNRISKVEEKAGTTTKDYTWYARDAQGNIIALYRGSGNVDTSTLQNLGVTMSEQMIYGSSRLGMYGAGAGVDNNNQGPVSRQFYGGGFFERGRKQYELSNHLGNVLTTISDRKFGVSSGAIGSLIDYYEPDIVSATDYYPFGMVSRVGQTTTGVPYRFGFNGKENDNEPKDKFNQQDYGMRIYDPRVGRFLSVDPITKEYPELTPYQFASNRPIDGIDFDGLEYTPATIGDGTARRDQTAVQMRENPKWETNPFNEAYKRRYNLPRNYDAFSTNLPPISDYAKQKQIANNERNWLELGYNKDGSLTGAQRLMRNKYWTNFDKNLATPLLEGYSYLSGLAEIRALAILKNVTKVATKAPALSDDIASTFMGGKYTSMTTKEDMVLYRAGEEGKPLGQFFSIDAPVSVLQTKIDKAVLPVWPSGAKSVLNTGFEIKIPAGTNIYIGTVAPQGGIYLGGTQQIVVLKPWEIKGVEVLRSFPLKK